MFFFRFLYLINLALCSLNIPPGFTAKEITSKDNLCGLEDVLARFESSNNPAIISLETLQKYLDIRESCKYKTVVIEEKGVIIAACSYNIEPKLIHGGCYRVNIEEVAVNKNYERMGLGKLVVQIAINNAKKTLKDKLPYKIQLTCKEKNVEFYKRLGFNEAIEKVMVIRYD